MTKPSACEIEIVIKKRKSHKPPGIDQIPAEVVKTGDRTIRSDICKLINSIWNICLMSGSSRSLCLFIRRAIRHCSNYRGMPFLSTTNKILFNFLLSRSTSYAEEIFGDRHCGFRSNSSTNDHILSIRQILEKKWE